MAVLLFHIQELIGASNIVDKTGLTGAYDIRLECSVAGLPGFSAIHARIARAGTETTNTACEPLPDLFTALEKQLGLKLEKKKGVVDTLVIDHAGKIPAEN